MERSTPAAHVAANVRAELGRQRRTQGDLAQALGRSQPYVSRRLAGKVAFDLDALTAVAGYLGVPLSALLDGAAPAPSPATADVA